MPAQMVLLSAQRHGVPEIVNIRDRSNIAVCEWFGRFDARGPKGLCDFPRSGRSAKVYHGIEPEVEEAISELSTKKGFNCIIWTTVLLRAHVERVLDVTVWDDSSRCTLHVLDCRWRHPRWAVE